MDIIIKSGKRNDVEGSFSTQDKGVSGKGNQNYASNPALTDKLDEVERNEEEQLKRIIDEVDQRQHPMDCIKSINEIKSDQETKPVEIIDKEIQEKMKSEKDNLDTILKTNSIEGYGIKSDGTKTTIQEDDKMRAMDVQSMITAITQSDAPNKEAKVWIPFEEIASSSKKKNVFEFKFVDNKMKNKDEEPVSTSTSPTNYEKKSLLSSETDDLKVNGEEISYGSGGKDAFNIPLDNKCDETNEKCEKQRSIKPIETGEIRKKSSIISKKLKKIKSAGDKLFNNLPKDKNEIKDNKVCDKKSPSDSIAKNEKCEEQHEEITCALTDDDKTITGKEIDKNETENIQIVADNSNTILESHFNEDNDFKCGHMDITFDDRAVTDTLNAKDTNGCKEDVQSMITVITQSDILSEKAKMLIPLEEIISLSHGDETKPADDETNKSITGQIENEIGNSNIIIEAHSDEENGVKSDFMAVTQTQKSDDQKNCMRDVQSMITVITQSDTLSKGAKILIPLEEIESLSDKEIKTTDDQLVNQITEKPKSEGDSSKTILKPHSAEKVTIESDNKDDSDDDKNDPCDNTVVTKTPNTDEPKSCNEDVQSMLDVITQSDNPSKEANVMIPLDEIGSSSKMKNVFEFKFMESKKKDEPVSTSTSPTNYEKKSLLSSETDDLKVNGEEISYGSGGKDAFNIPLDNKCDETNEKCEKQRSIKPIETGEIRKKSSIISKKLKKIKSAGDKLFNNLPKDKNEIKDNKVCDKKSPSDSIAKNEKCEEQHEEITCALTDDDKTITGKEIDKNETENIQIVADNSNTILESHFNEDNDFKCGHMDITFDDRAVTDTLNAKDTNGCKEDVQSMITVITQSDILSEKAKMLIPLEEIISLSHGDETKPADDETNKSITGQIENEIGNSNIIIEAHSDEENGVKSDFMAVTQTQKSDDQKNCMRDVQSMITVITQSDTLSKGAKILIPLEEIESLSDKEIKTTDDQLVNQITEKPKSEGDSSKTILKPHSAEKVTIESDNKDDSDDDKNDPCDNTVVTKTPNTDEPKSCNEDVQSMLDVITQSDNPSKEANVMIPLDEIGSSSKMKNVFEFKFMESKKKDEPVSTSTSPTNYEKKSLLSSETDDLKVNGEEISYGSGGKDAFNIPLDNKWDETNEKCEKQRSIKPIETGEIRKKSSIISKKLKKIKSAGDKLFNNLPKDKNEIKDNKVCDKKSPSDSIAKNEKCEEQHEEITCALTDDDKTITGKEIDKNETENIQIVADNSNTILESHFNEDNDFKCGHMDITFDDRAVTDTLNAKDTNGCKEDVQSMITVITQSDILSEKAKMLIPLEEIISLSHGDETKPADDETNKSITGQIENEIGNSNIIIEAHSDEENGVKSDFMAVTQTQKSDDQKNCMRDVQSMITVITQSDTLSKGAKILIPLEEIESLSDKEIKTTDDQLVNQITEKPKSEGDSSKTILKPHSAEKVTIESDNKDDSDDDKNDPCDNTVVTKTPNTDEPKSCNEDVQSMLDVITQSDNPSKEANVMIPLDEIGSSSKMKNVFEFKFMESKKKDEPVSTSTSPTNYEKKSLLSSETDDLKVNGEEISYGSGGKDAFNIPLDNKCDETNEKCEKQRSIKPIETGEIRKKSSIISKKLKKIKSAGDKLFNNLPKDKNEIKDNKVCDKKSPSDSIAKNEKCEEQHEEITCALTDDDKTITCKEIDKNETENIQIVADNSNTILESHFNEDNDFKCGHMDITFDDRAVMDTLNAKDTNGCKEDVQSMITVITQSDILSEKAKMLIPLEEIISLSHDHETKTTGEENNAKIAKQIESEVDNSQIIFKVPSPQRADVEGDDKDVVSNETPKRHYKKNCNEDIQSMVTVITQSDNPSKEAKILIPLKEIVPSKVKNIFQFKVFDYKMENENEDPVSTSTSLMDHEKISTFSSVTEDLKGKAESIRTQLKGDEPKISMNTKCVESGNEECVKQPTIISIDGVEIHNIPFSKSTEVKKSNCEGSKLTSGLSKEETFASKEPKEVTCKIGDDMAVTETLNAGDKKKCNHEVESMISVITQSEIPFKEAKILIPLEEIVAPSKKENVFEFKFHEGKANNKDDYISPSSQINNEEKVISSVTEKLKEKEGKIKTEVQVEDMLKVIIGPHCTECNEKCVKHSIISIPTWELHNHSSISSVEVQDIACEERDKLLAGLSKNIITSDANNEACLDSKIENIKCEKEDAEIVYAHTARNEETNSTDDESDKNQIKDIENEVVELDKITEFHPIGDDDVKNEVILTVPGASKKDDTINYNENIQSMISVITQSEIPSKEARILVPLEEINSPPTKENICEFKFNNIKINHKVTDTLSPSSSLIDKQEKDLSSVIDDLKEIEGKMYNNESEEKGLHELLMNTNCVEEKERAKQNPIKSVEITEIQEIPLSSSMEGEKFGSEGVKLYSDPPQEIINKEDEEVGCNKFSSSSLSKNAKCAEHYEFFSEHSSTSNTSTVDLKCGKQKFEGGQEKIYSVNSNESTDLQTLNNSKCLNQDNIPQIKYGVSRNKMPFIKYLINKIVDPKESETKKNNNQDEDSSINYTDIRDETVHGIKNARKYINTFDNHDEKHYKKSISSKEEELGKTSFDEITDSKIMINENCKEKMEGTSGKSLEVSKINEIPSDISTSSNSERYKREENTTTATSCTQKEHGKVFLSKSTDSNSVSKIHQKLTNTKSLDIHLNKVKIPFCKSADPERLALETCEVQIDFPSSKFEINREIQDNMPGTVYSEKYLKTKNSLEDEQNFGTIVKNEKDSVLSTISTNIHDSPIMSPNSGNANGDNADQILCKHSKDPILPTDINFSEDEEFKASVNTNFKEERELSSEEPNTSKDCCKLSNFKSNYSTESTESKSSNGESNKMSSKTFVLPKSSVLEFNGGKPKVYTFLCNKNISATKDNPNCPVPLLRKNKSNEKNICARKEINTTTMHEEINQRERPKFSLSRKEREAVKGKNESKNDKNTLISKSATFEVESQSQILSDKEDELKYVQSKLKENKIGQASSIDDVFSLISDVDCKRDKESDLSHSMYKDWDKINMEHTKLYNMKLFDNGHQSEPVAPYRRKSSVSLNALSTLTESDCSKDKNTRIIFGLCSNSSENVVAPPRKKLVKRNSLLESSEAINSTDIASHKLSCSTTDIDTISKNGVRRLLNDGNKHNENIDRNLSALDLDITFSKQSTSPEMSAISNKFGNVNKQTLERKISTESLDYPARRNPDMRKRSHTFTIGDLYMEEIRKNIVVKKKSNSMKKLIKRTFSVRDVRKANNPPCLPNLFKRFRKRRRSQCNLKHLPTIAEEKSARIRSSESFASIFMHDCYDEDEEGLTYLERCTSNFEPYLSYLAFPEPAESIRRSISNIEMSSFDITQQSGPQKPRRLKRSLSCFTQNKRANKKIVSEDSSISLDAVAIKKAQEMFNRSMNMKKDQEGVSAPLRPKRSKSRLSLDSIPGSESDIGAQIIIHHEMDENGSSSVPNEPITKENDSKSLDNSCETFLSIFSSGESMLFERENSAVFDTVFCDDMEVEKDDRSLETSINELTSGEKVEINSNDEDLLKNKSLITSEALEAVANEHLHNAKESINDLQLKSSGPYPVDHISKNRYINRKQTEEIMKGFLNKYLCESKIAVNPESLPYEFTNFNERGSKTDENRDCINDTTEYFKSQVKHFLIDSSHSFERESNNISRFNVECEGEEIIDLTSTNLAELYEKNISEYAKQLQLDYTNGKGNKLDDGKERNNENVKGTGSAVFDVKECKEAENIAKQYEKEILDACKKIQLQKLNLFQMLANDYEEYISAYATNLQPKDEAIETVRSKSAKETIYLSKVHNRESLSVPNQHEKEISNDYNRDSHQMSEDYNRKTANFSESSLFLDSKSDKMESHDLTEKIIGPVYKAIAEVEIKEINDLAKQFEIILDACKTIQEEEEIKHQIFASEKPANWQISSPGIDGKENICRNVKLNNGVPEFNSELSRKKMENVVKEYEKEIFEACKNIHLQSYTSFQNLSKEYEREIIEYTENLQRNLRRNSRLYKHGSLCKMKISGNYNKNKKDYGKTEDVNVLTSLEYNKPLKQSMNTTTAEDMENLANKYTTEIVALAADLAIKLKTESKTVKSATFAHKDEEKLKTIQNRVEKNSVNSETIPSSCLSKRPSLTRRRVSFDSPLERVIGTSYKYNSDLISPIYDSDFSASSEFGFSPCESEVSQLRKNTNNLRPNNPFLVNASLIQPLTLAKLASKVYSNDYNYYERKQGENVTTFKPLHNLNGLPYADKQGGTRRFSCNAELYDIFKDEAQPCPEIGPTLEHLQLGLKNTVSCSNDIPSDLIPLNSDGEEQVSPLTNTFLSINHSYTPNLLSKSTVGNYFHFPFFKDPGEYSYANQERDSLPMASNDHYLSNASLVESPSEYSTILQTCEGNNRGDIKDIDSPFPEISSSLLRPIDQPPFTVTSSPLTQGNIVSPKGNDSECLENSILENTGNNNSEVKSESHESEALNNFEMENINTIKEQCSLNCECHKYMQSDSVKILATRQKSWSYSLSTPEIILRTWSQRQEKKEEFLNPASVVIPKWVTSRKDSTTNSVKTSSKDTSSPGPPPDHCKEDPSQHILQDVSKEFSDGPHSTKKEEDRIQKDRCIEIYPETLRQRQRNMAPSPSKVDIKNWEPTSAVSNEEDAKGKKFLPSVKALRNQFENGKPVSRDIAPSTSPPSSTLGRTSSSSSTSSLIMSSLDASSGFGSLTSSQTTIETLPIHLPRELLDDDPVEPIFSQFKGVDDELKELMSKPPSTAGWNPQPLLKRLYYVPDAPKIHSQGTAYINIEGYLEKLPSGRKKATFWNAWKRRFFVAKDGIFYYYQNNQTEKPSMKLPLMGGKIEIMDPNMVSVDDGERESRSAGMLGIDDGKGHYVVVRCSSRQEAERWKRALETHTVDDFSSQYVQPWPRPTNPTLLRDTLVIDIGSCSVRAGVLTSQATLPQLFFPSVLATNRESRRQVWGMEGLMPDVRSGSSITFPVRPSHKISKFSVDLNAISSLLQKTFQDLKVDPKNYNIQLSVPRILNPHTQAELLKILFDKYGVKSVNLTHQSILALYAYNATSGIVVDIGERMDVVPVIDGYIVDGGVSRVPYGGYRIMDHLRQFLFQRNVSLVNEVESYIIRQVLETVCYCAQHYNTEKSRCTMNPENFEKTVPLEEFFPSTSPQFEIFQNISLEFGRFQATEGLFNPDAWGLDHPGLHKLVHKAIQECSMDIRKEMSRSIFLAGGVTQLPGIAERLTIELDNLTPPAIRPKVHSSPYRYHAAYLGACVLAESPAFAQSKITKEEWHKQGNSAIGKWSL